MGFHPFSLYLQHGFGDRWVRTIRKTPEAARQAADMLTKKLAELESKQSNVKNLKRLLEQKKYRLEN